MERWAKRWPGRNFYHPTFLAGVSEMEIPVHTMSIAEKLDAMEQLWTSMQGLREQSLPEWHGELLAERQKRIDSGLDRTIQR